MNTLIWAGLAIILMQIGIMIFLRERQQPAPQTRTSPVNMTVFPSANSQAATPQPTSPPPPYSPPAVETTAFEEEEEADPDPIANSKSADANPDQWRPSHAQTLYAALGVANDAHEDTLRKAYRTLVKRWHTDINPDPNAATEFALVRQAYEILSDEEQRQRYDAGLWLEQEATC